MSSWTAVAASAAVTTTPRALRVGDRDWTAVRLTPDGSPRLFAALCPHRLVPLVAAQVDGGRLRCRYHGWEFDESGACTLVPSLGPDARVPVRASLPEPPPTRERDGVIEVLLDRSPPGQLADLVGLGNEDPRLLAAWHPVALSIELPEQPVEVLLLGRRYELRRTAETLSCLPEPYAIAERWGLVWLAPQRPTVPLFNEPDAEDLAYVGAWLPPERTPAPAGFVADNFLDAAHFPFVHAATFGAADGYVIEPYDVHTEPGGFRSVQLQEFDNPQDPAVLVGDRPLRQRRRATYVYRAPFQLLLRLEELDTGAVKTILFCLQPESAASTRIYTKLLLHGIGGQARPDAELVAAEVAFEQAVLAEDLALQEILTVPVLPLDLRSELHVRADRLGIALRRALRDLVEPRGLV